MGKTFETIDPALAARWLRPAWSRRVSVQRGEAGSRQFQQCTIAAAEVAARPVEHEADQQTRVGVHRQRDCVIEADRAVVLVVQRGAPELGERHRVADPLDAAPVGDAVVTHQWMFAEEPVERGAVARADGVVRRGDHVAPSGDEVADRQRRHLRGDQPGQQLHAGARERSGVGAALEHRLHDAQRRAVAAGVDRRHRRCPAFRASAGLRNDAHGRPPRIRATSIGVQCPAARRIRWQPTMPAPP